MSKADRSAYQNSVINAYYKNLDTIMLTKLSELVGELYLAESQSKRERLWQRVEKALNHLNIPPSIKDHILTRKDVEVLAKNLNEWLAIGKK